MFIKEIFDDMDNNITIRPKIKLDTWKLASCILFIVANKQFTINKISLELYYKTPWDSAFHCK